MKIHGFSVDKFESFIMQSSKEDNYVLKNISVFFKRLSYAIVHREIITNKKLTNWALTTLEENKKSKSFEKVKKICAMTIPRIKHNQSLKYRLDQISNPKPKMRNSSSHDSLKRNSKNTSKVDSTTTSDSGNEFTEKISTNLIENRPSWVPQECISKAGLLSPQNFHYCCCDLKLLVQDQKAQRKFQWFFSQRKFPMNNAGTDTIAFPEDIPWDVFMSKQFQLCPVRDGYAISISAHGPSDLFFISDNDIIHIEKCASVRLDKTLHVAIGVYKDGKTMIQQQGVRGCVAACAAMIAEDNGEACSVEDLQTTNLSDTQGLLRMLNTTNIRANAITVTTITQLNNLIASYGPISIGIDSSIGGHQIILDAIDDENAIIRDPFHGWRITIPTKTLFNEKMNNEIEAVYVER